MKLKDLFIPHNACSKAYKDHEIGDIPFVSSGLLNNGVVGFVKPLKGERVFHFRGICLSAFCDATVHESPFLPRGNGGSGLIILEPKSTMPFKKLIYYATYINNDLKWRFSFGRMVKKNRIENIKMPDYDPTIECLDPSSLLPLANNSKITVQVKQIKNIPINELFDIKSGHFHSRRKLKDGYIPLISCSSKNNGISGYFEIDESFTHEGKLTVTYDGQPLIVRYHPYRFTAYDNVGILTPKINLRFSTIIFVAFIIEREKWRFSYGRKCYREKLNLLKMQIPVNEEGRIDEDIIAEIVSNSSYWNYFREKSTIIQ